MSTAQHPPIATDKVVAVLLADGWHRVVAGSFTVGPLGFGSGDDDSLGFCFEELDDASPHGPAALAGPLSAVLAVRQVRSAAWRRQPFGMGDGDAWSRSSPSPTRRAPNRGAAA